MKVEISDMHDSQQAVDRTRAGAVAYRKKQLLVVVLVIGLLIAIVTQPDDEPVSHLPIKAVQQRAEGNTVNGSSTAQAFDAVVVAPQDLAGVRELSRFELDELVLLDLITPEPVGQLQLSAISKKHPVRAIYGTSDGRSALVGDSILRSGQPLPGGGNVTAVTTDGIQVSP